MPGITKISPFQALVLLAQAYRGKTDKEDKAQYKKVMRLFLTGIKNAADRDIYNELIKDPCLKGYEISDTRETINNDPVRRYFETHLCHESLREGLDGLDPALLESHFNALFHEMPKKLQLSIPTFIYHGDEKGLAALKSDTAPEYIAAIKKLRKPKSYNDLTPRRPDLKGASRKKAEAAGLQRRKDKMMLLAKATHAAMSGVNTYTRQGKPDRFPLNLYSKKGYYYDGPLRGKRTREGEAVAGDEREKQVVESQNLGVMRSWMPVPIGDRARAGKPATYVRPSDRSTYVDGEEALMPDIMFDQLVTPFVNSISGTMLCQLRMIAKLLQDNKLVYKNHPEQFIQYLKMLVSYMSYNSGGHSLYEFTLPLLLPEVQEMFKDIPGFADISLQSLFQDDNEAAFEAALDRCIAYNDAIVHRQTLHHELTSAHRKEDATDPNDSEHSQESEEEIIVDPGFFDETYQDEVEKKDYYDEKTAAARQRLEHIDVDDPGPSPLLALAANIDEVYRVWVDPKSPEDSRDEARRVLIEKLHLNPKETSGDPLLLRKEEERLIHEKVELIKRTVFTQLPLRGSNKVLSERIDLAWEIYQSDESFYLEREVAQEFLIYALDIQEPGVELNKKLRALMTLRENLKADHPHFIPRLLHNKAGEGVTAFNPLMAVFKPEETLSRVKKAREKDEGKGPGGKKTVMFEEEERDLFRVDIHRGTFMIDGEKVNTRHSISHDKEGFAAYTLNTEGELHIFQHIDHDATGIAHSSLTGGKDVFSAGEVKIEDGKLLAITTYSGHYRPRLYDIYQTLNYFKMRGIDISETKVISFRDPGDHFQIKSKPIKGHGNLKFECDAGDLVHAYRAKLGFDLKQIRSELVDYRKSKAPGKVGGFFSKPSKSRMKKIEIAEQLIQFIDEESKKLKKTEDPEAFLKLITAMESQFGSKKALVPKKLTGRIARFFGKEKNSTLTSLLEKFEGQLKAEQGDLSKPDISGSQLSSSHEDTLKGIGRKRT